MRYFRRCRIPAGLILAGLLIILAILLPAVCWWLFLGVAFVAAGILLVRR